MLKRVFKRKIYGEGMTNESEADVFFVFKRNK